jgi:chemotaxis protein CheX
MNQSRSSLASATERESWAPTLQVATQEVYELMLGCELEVAAEPPPDQGLDITAMVGLAGQLRGILRIRCKAKSACRMASRMLGLEAPEAGAETWDAVGEICNMVAGNLKNKISGLGEGCMLSVPTVITGGDYRMRSMVNQRIQASFRFEGEPLILTLEFH